MFFISYVYNWFVFADFVYVLFSVIVLFFYDFR